MIARVKRAKKAKAPRKKRASGGSRKGKGKGASFERKVCKALSMWVSGGMADDWFWRSAMSGGRATIGNRTGADVRQAGDICAISPQGHALTDIFYIECKFYKSLDIEAFILGRGGRLAQFWKVACKEARLYHRTPMLIAKQNITDTLVIMLSGYMELQLGSQASFASVWSYGPRYKCSIAYFDEMLKEPFAPKERGKK